jgi:hypothetical protein
VNGVPSAGLDLDAITDGATGWDADWIAQLPGHLPSSTYLAPDLAGRASWELAALLADVVRLVAEVRRLRTERDQLLTRQVPGAVVAAWAAELADVATARDQLRAELRGHVDRLRRLASERRRELEVVGARAGWTSMLAVHLRCLVQAVEQAIGSYQPLSERWRTVTTTTGQARAALAALDRDAPPTDPNQPDAVMVSGTTDLTKPGVAEALTEVGRAAARHLRTLDETRQPTPPAEPTTDQLTNWHEHNDHTEGAERG